MVFPELALARRLEDHEALSSLAHARTQAQLYPETGAAWLPAGGGWAVFAGQKSPLNSVYALGLSRPVMPDDLDEVKAFFAAHGASTNVRVCPLADRSLLELLAQHRYILKSFMNVYVCKLPAEASSRPLHDGITIRTATTEEARQWFEVAGAGGGWAEPDGISFMTVRTVQKPGAQLFVAWDGDQPVGGGGLEVRDGLAALIAAETLPAYRGRGVHSALIYARLAAAVGAGCDLAMVHTSPGTPSQRNVLRAGFDLVYTLVNMAQPLGEMPAGSLSA